MKSTILIGKRKKNRKYSLITNTRAHRNPSPICCVVANKQHRNRLARFSFNWAFFASSHNFFSFAVQEKKKVNSEQSSVAYANRRESHSVIQYILRRSKSIEPFFQELTFCANSKTKSFSFFSVQIKQCAFSYLPLNNLWVNFNKIAWCESFESKGRQIK